MTDPARKSAHNLTPREEEVLRLMGRGLPNKSIAKELGVGMGTTRKYVQGVLQKIGVHSKLEAIALLLAQERDGA